MIVVLLNGFCLEVDLVDLRRKHNILALFPMFIQTETYLISYWFYQMFKPISEVSVTLDRRTKTLILKQA